MDADRIIHALAASAAAALLAGCTATAPVIEADATMELAAGEAALVVERDGRPSWSELYVVAEADGKRVALKLDGSGYGLGIYRLPAGRYSMVAVKLLLSREIPFTTPEPFEVHPGKLNYLGEVAFRRDSDGEIWHAFENRSGRMLTELRGRQRALVDRWPVLYVGEDGDDWTSSFGTGR